jgi:hypothetical protein
MNIIRHINKNIHLQGQLHAITIVSELGFKYDIEPAQLMRILRSKFHSDWNKHLKSEISTADLESLICTQILPDLGRGLYKRYLSPNHFLLKTSINVGNNTIDTTPTINFIRTQRRYKKRRYARVRANSRPSFWAGMLFSTLMTAAFWGATIQELDWLSTTVIVTNPNIVIFALYCVVILRLVRLITAIPKSNYRENAKSKRGWKRILLREGGTNIVW